MDDSLAGGERQASKVSAGSDLGGYGGRHVGVLHILGLCGIALLSIVLRLPFLSVPLTVDEGGYGLWAWMWTSEFQIYRDFIFARPQGIILIYELIQWVSDGSTEAIRLFAAAYNALTVVVIFALARRIFGERAGWLGAIVFAIFSAAPRVEGFTANAELFTFLPLALNAWMVWERRWFWAGVATSIAFQIKPSGIEGCVLIAICALFGSTTWRKAITSSASALGGFLLAAIPMVVHAASIGWEHFVYNLVTLRGLSYHPEVVSLAAQRENFSSAVAWTFTSWIVPALLCAVAFRGFDAERRRFFGAWLLGATIAMAIGFYWSWHFFLQLLPPFSVAAGAGWQALRRDRLRLVWSTALGLSALLFLLREGSFFVGKSAKEICWDLYHRPSYLTVHETADYVARTTSADSLVYVAFGEPELYYLARRRPAVMTQLFNGHARWIDSSWEDAITAVQRRVPEVIVWAQPPPQHRMSSREFAGILAAGYQPEVMFGVIRVFRRLESAPPPPPEGAAAGGL